METKSLNKSLCNAKKTKNDEFYTQLVDIEKELRHYKAQFEGKVVYCNCDDPYESHFFKYFVSVFNEWKLKKLIDTSYNQSKIISSRLSLFGTDGSDGKKTLKVEITEVPDEYKDGAISLDDVERLLKHDKNTATPLKGSGDFRSDECIELLKQADIVCTNPPFSLFREYVDQLVEHDKKFLIIGNINAVGYKDFFKLIKDNKVRLGISIRSGDREFRIPDDYPLKTAFGRIGSDGHKYVRLSFVRWFTNLYCEGGDEEFVLYKRYSHKEYPKYDNYDAIEVSKVKDIPMDYDGVMGVPVTFLDKYNPEQFEILAATSKAHCGKYLINGNETTAMINGKKLYRRILIRNKKPQK